MKHLLIVAALLTGSFAVEAQNGQVKVRKQTTVTTGAQSANASVTGKTRSALKGANGKHLGQTKVKTRVNSERRDIEMAEETRNPSIQTTKKVKVNRGRGNGKG